MCVCVCVCVCGFFCKSYKESIADKSHALEREVDNCSLQLLVAPQVMGKWDTSQPAILLQSSYLQLGINCLSYLTRYLWRRKSDYRCECVLKKNVRKAAWHILHLF